MSISRGKRGKLRQRYHEELENPLGALDLVLNCVVLWNTIYMNAGVAQLRTQGYPATMTTLHGCRRCAQAY